MQMRQECRGTAKGGRPALYSINAHSQNLNALTCDLLVSSL